MNTYPVKPYHFMGFTKSALVEAIEAESNAPCTPTVFAVFQDFHDVAGFLNRLTPTCEDAAIVRSTAGGNLCGPLALAQEK